MEDETYAFIEDVKSRKDIAKSAKNKKSGKCPRKVRFPSDYLSKKEREAMNGECKTWSMFKFYDWDEFREMAADIQVRYLNNILERYGVGTSTISRYQFKKSSSNLDKYLAKHGLIDKIKRVNKNGISVAANIPRYLEALARQNNVEITHSEPEKPADIFIPDGMAPGYCSDGVKAEDSIKEIVRSKLIFGDEDEKKVATDELVTKAFADISQEKPLPTSINRLSFSCDGFDFDTFKRVAALFEGKKVTVSMSIYEKSGSDFSNEL